MDGISRRASNQATALLVRQFAPSRLERQLLAQAYERVCGFQGAAQRWSAETRREAGSQCSDASEGAAAALNAGRRAA